MAPAGIVLPSLTSDAGRVRGSSRSDSSSSGPEDSGEADAAAIDAALDEEAAEAAHGGAGHGGRQGRDGGKSGGKDVVDAIASGMQRSGMQPGMVRPPAMVTGGQGGSSRGQGDAQWRLHSRAHCKST